MQIPKNGYKALKHHFKTGAMEISSDELEALPIQRVSKRYCDCDKPIPDFEYVYSYGLCGYIIK